MAFRQAQHQLSVSTPGRGFTDITQPLERWCASIEAAEGLLTLFIRHTSASLVVQENADRDVRIDLERFFAELVPDGDSRFVHTAEGPDDMPSHVRAALTQTQLSIPLHSGALVLGTWQAVYLYEHRKAAHQRKVALHFIGE